MPLLAKLQVRNILVTQTTTLHTILMAYDRSASLKDRFGNARQCLVEMFPRYLGQLRAIRGL